MAEAPGTDIGPYRIVTPIGSGGFSTVYLARDQRLDDDVALKILAENRALDPDLRERFLDEARLMRRIDSPHVVRILDIGETARCQPYLVLEYAAGGSLEERVVAARANGWKPSVSDVRVVARALADALGAVHSVDVVHRDVSPSNLLIRPTTGADGPAGIVAADERLVLADLGLAKDLAQHSGLTVGGGTPRFAAPEQRGGATRVDRRVDVYAASGVLAWMLIGDHSWSTDRGPSAARVASAGMPIALVDALQSGLADDPADRPDDMEAWFSAVEVALAPRTDAPVPVERARAEPQSDVDDPGGPRGVRARVRSATLMGLVGLVVGAAVALLVLGGGADRPERTSLDDNRVRVSDESGTVAAALFGPVTAAVGETVVVEAGANGAVDFVWILPDGTLVDGTDRVDFVAVEGEQTVRLVVSGGAGEAVDLDLTIDGRADP